MEIDRSKKLFFESHSAIFYVVTFSLVSFLLVFQILSFQTCFSVPILVFNECTAWASRLPLTLTLELHPVTEVFIRVRVKGPEQNSLWLQVFSSWAAHEQKSLIAHEQQLGGGGFQQLRSSSAACWSLLVTLMKQAEHTKDYSNWVTESRMGNSHELGKGKEVLMSSWAAARSCR